LNYFAHGYPFVDDPYFLAGTAAPDWLAVVDRRVRVRPRHAEQLAADPDPAAAALGRGLLQHFRDDARFHETRAFAETSLALTVAARDVLAGESGFRPSFLGHLLTEVLLDAVLIAAMPQRLEAYYRTMDALDGRVIEAAINRVAPRPAEHLALMIGRFSAERFLSDYADDAKLMVRLNQVMRRLQLAPLPPGFIDVVGLARRRVSQRREELLAGIPVPPPTETPA